MFLSAEYVPGTVLKTLSLLSHFVPTMALREENHFCFYFADEKTKAWGDEAS